MHITLDMCRKTRYLHQIMIALCVLSIVLYAANKYYYFAPNLTPMGILRRLPYYYIGYVMGQKQLFRSANIGRDLIGCILCFGIIILFFHWHLQAYDTGQYILHIALFYPVNIGFLFGILYGCKVLNSWRSILITNLSIGTLVIIGLHIVPITVTNYILENLLHSNNAISYHWYEALPISIVIVVILYPIILLGKKHFPVLLGRKNT